MQSRPDDHPHDVPQYPDIFLSIQSSDKPFRESYDTEFLLPIDVDGEPRGFIIDVMSVTMPNGVYPINEYNNTVYIEEFATLIVTTVQIPSNNYNGIQFAAELQTQLNAAGLVDTYTVVFDTQSERLTVSSTGTFRFVALLVDGEYYDMYDEMGFDRVMFGSYVASQTGEGGVSLGGTDKIFIATNIGSFYRTSKDRERIFAEVPMDVGYGGIVHYYPPKNFDVYVSTNHIQDFAVQLRDSKHRLWKLPRTMHWSMTLRIRRLFPEVRIGDLSKYIDSYPKRMRE